MVCGIEQKQVDEAYTEYEQLSRVSSQGIDLGSRIEERRSGRAHATVKKVITWRQSFGQTCIYTGAFFPNSQSHQQKLPGFTLQLLGMLTHLNATFPQV